MTPVPSQTPSSQDSGARSAGRSVGSSITTDVGSALAAEKVHEHDAGDEDDGKTREPQQAEEEDFERNGIHALSVAADDAPGASERGGQRRQPEGGGDQAHH